MSLLLLLPQPTSTIIRPDNGITYRPAASPPMTIRPNDGVTRRPKF